MTLILNLEPEVTSRLHEEAARRGISEEAVAAELIDNALPQSDSFKLSKGGNPIIQRTDENTGDYLIRLSDEFRASISDDEWAELPSDHARNYKHYLYGARKEE